MIHPSQALHDSANEQSSRAISACEHIAGSEKMIIKSLAIQKEKNGQFDITLDLEDGAIQGNEAQQLMLVIDHLQSKANEFKRLGVRIHPSSSIHFKDELETIVRSCGEVVAYITLPKVSSSQEVSNTAKQLKSLCAQYGVNRTIPLHVLIETHTAIQDIHTIAKVDSVESLNFGIMDYIAEFNGLIPASAISSPEQFSNPMICAAKIAISQAAHASGKVANHNVTVAYSDAEQTFSDALRAKHEFAFARMWSIHPTQIDPILRAMAPSDAELQLATDILIAAQNNDWGPISHNQQLHDCASFRSYWNMLKQAKLLSRPLPSKAEERWFS